MAIKLFGFRFERDKPENLVSVSAPNNDDGALIVPNNPYYGTYHDFDGVTKNERELITRYRDMSMQPEIDSAIDDIINEAIVDTDDGKSVKLVLDNVKTSPKIKSFIYDEFDLILKLLNYKKLQKDIFRKFYVDGRLYYHIVVDKNDTSSGIKELRYLDPLRVRKIRETETIKDKETGADVVRVVDEYYLYSTINTRPNIINGKPTNGTRLTTDSVVQVTSGLMDTKRQMVLSWLHKCIKPLNQLRMIEDSTVIYRVSRSPERRLWYIDTGDLAKPAAEKFVRDMMVKYKNKIVFDPASGQVRDDRRFINMTEDIWIPRRRDQTTEIKTLESVPNLGEIEDIKYFEKKLYKATCVPYSRVDSSDGFNLGRSTEISRDEVKFAKFVNGLRNRFSELFLQSLKVQCVLKGICTKEEFESWEDDIVFDFLKDNNFSELKELELFINRINALTAIDPYRGSYFSKEYIYKTVLKFDDKQISEMKKQLEIEAKENKDVPTNIENAVKQASMMNDIAMQSDQSVQEPLPDETESESNNPSGRQVKDPSPKEVPSKKKITSLNGKNKDE